MDTNRDWVNSENKLRHITFIYTDFKGRSHPEFGTQDKIISGHHFRTLIGQTINDLYIANPSSKKKYLWPRLTYIKSRSWIQQSKSILYNFDYWYWDTIFKNSITYTNSQQYTMSVIDDVLGNWNPLSTPHFFFELS